MITTDKIKERRSEIIAELRRCDPRETIIPGKAECLTMCPASEVQQRIEVEQSSISPFEMD